MKSQPLASSDLSPTTWLRLKDTPHERFLIVNYSTQNVTVIERYHATQLTWAALEGGYEMSWDLKTWWACTQEGLKASRTEGEATQP